MKYFKRLFAWWQKIKCLNDWHDYDNDANINVPLHFYNYTCKHCNRRFRI